MKKSQLKEAIKNEIRSVLSENMSLSEIQDQGLIDGINAITRDINMFGPPKLKSVAEIQTYVEAFKDGVEEEGRKISNDMKAAIGIGIDEEASLNEEEEPTSDDIEKEKSIAAEKEAALKAQKALKDLKGKMKKKAKEYKEAEGKAKDKIKAELKKMTAEKKKLEKDIK